MKRSEMVELIAKATESGYGNSFDDSLTYEQQLMAKQVAGLVLQFIEDAGMLPPLRKSTPDDFVNTGFTQDFLDEHDFETNGWEPEDE